jgi:hypothetical protein
MILAGLFLTLTITLNVMTITDNEMENMRVECVTVRYCSRTFHRSDRGKLTIFLIEDYSPSGRKSNPQRRDYHTTLLRGSAKLF